jgi:hypothetical protein
MKKLPEGERKKAQLVPVRPLLGLNENTARFYDIEHLASHRNKYPDRQLNISEQA